MHTCLPVTLSAPDICCVTGRFCCYQDRNCIQVRDSSSVKNIVALFHMFMYVNIKIPRYRNRPLSSAWTIINFNWYQLKNTRTDFSYYLNYSCSFLLRVYCFISIVLELFSNRFSHIYNLNSTLIKHFYGNE